MSYRIAGIDVHKRMLAVVVADVHVEGEYQFERLVKRLVAHELVLSFVPDVEQRLWRTVMRGKYQLRRNHVRLQNQLEALLEEAHIKLSTLVSDLLGASARRTLQALADGETDPAALAARNEARP